MINEGEDVLIVAGDFSVTVVPRLGAKIARIRVKDCDLLQTPLAPYSPRTRTMPFDEGDASGWDECLPSVASCEVVTAAGLTSIPDHGDLWRIEWQPVDSSVGTVKFRGECFSLSLALERSLTVSEVDKGWRLSLDYTVSNTGCDPVPWSWAAHPLFAVEPGDRILLPESIHALLLEGSGGGRLGKGGRAVSWPIATLANGSKLDLSVAQPPSSGIGDKLFAGPLAGAQNWCALERPSAGIRIRVRFDPVATPYLGLWICYGGWPDRPGPKQVCVALEPATAPVDSLARTGPWSRVLAPSEFYSWPLVIDFERIQQS